VGVRLGPAVGESYVPEVPSTWPGTKPEWAIYWAHLTIGLRPFDDFQYQYFIDIGAIFDFFDFDISLAINVQGLYWHYELGGWKFQNDREQAIRAQAMGFDLIFIDEDDANADPIYFLKEARRGIDHSRVTRGYR